MPTPSKQALQRELLAALRATLATLEAAHASTREGATHEEAKPENDKDTRALEQSYLARGQALRLAALAQGIAAVEGLALGRLAACGVGALVEAEDGDGAPVRFFLAPDGGGTRLSGGVQVVTPASPLGQALRGKGPGDEVELRLQGKTRHLTVTRVR